MKKPTKVGRLVLGGIITVISLAAAVLALMRDETVADLTCKALGLDTCHPAFWSEAKAKQYCDSNTLQPGATGPVAVSTTWIADPKKTYAACERGYGPEVGKDTRFQNAAIAAGQIGAAKSALWDIVRTTQDQRPLAEALSLLGREYWYTSHFGEERKVLALMYLQAAADLGDPKATVVLAVITKKGYCVFGDQKNPDSWAGQLLERASVSDPYKFYETLTPFSDGPGGCTAPQKEQATKLMARALASGDIRARFVAANWMEDGYVTPADIGLSGTWESFGARYIDDLTRLFEAGSVTAGGYLAAEYYRGRFVRRDFVRSFSIRKDMANEGSGNAQYLVACFLDRHMEDCDGVEKSAPDAKKYYLQAIANNHPGAMNAVGFHHCTGEGYSVDVATCLELLSTASDYGNSWAPRNLGDFYLQRKEIGAANLGVKQPETARKWFIIAAGRGNTDAMRQLIRYYPDAPEAELLAAFVAERERQGVE